MSVIVDQTPLPAESLGLNTIGQLLAHLRKDNRLIVNVVIDGKSSDPKRIRAIKRSTLADHAIQIETADPRQIAHQVLDEVEAQLIEVDRLTSESAALLEQQQVASAVEKLGGCFSAWRHVQESIFKVAQLRRIDIETIKVHGRAFTDLIADFASQLRQMRSALDGRDFATLGDLLTHKMNQVAEQWRDALRSFRGVICV
ncbi:MAG: hypothetical protein ABIP55_02105 [Tepidisphaeraceae bacterium]